MAAPTGRPASDLPDINESAPRAGQIAFWAAATAHGVLIGATLRITDAG